MSAPHYLFRHRITLEPATARGARGPVWGAPVELRAHVERSAGMRVDRAGQEVRLAATAILPPDPAVAVESRVTWQGVAYRVVQATPMPAPHGRLASQELALSPMRGGE